MNRMKEKPWTVLVISVILKCFGEVDAHRVHLHPNPIAKVEEGNTLILQCSYHGSNTPDFINWYLNDDTFGLAIEASSCNYHSALGHYETDRYSISCHETNFTLSIANISKDRDDQDTWTCDADVFGMDPHHKASTTIVVIDAGKNGQFDEPKTVVDMWIVGVILSCTVIIIVAAVYCVHFLRRKRRNDRLKKINEDHDKDLHYEGTIMMSKNDDDHEQMGTPRADGHACGK